MRKPSLVGRQRGFTLIELMIVVAIIGVLASVAVPAYQGYVIKSRMANVIGSVHSLKAAIGVCIHDAGGVATSCSTGGSGIPVFTATKEIQSATTTAGTIVLTLASGIGTDIDGETITMSPVIGSSSLNWTNTTSVTNPAALNEITKYNPAGS